MDSSADERLQIPLAVITGALDGYERGEVSLARLVADVETGIDALAGVADDAWVAELRTAWSGLEIVQALAADAPTSALTEPARRDVAESLAELRAALAARP
jgi:hypothetical protein